MNRIYVTKCFRLLFLLILFFSKNTTAQLIYQPYSYQFYQKLNSSVYSPSNRLHTSIKPLLISETGDIKDSYDSLMGNGVDHRGESWAHRKIFHEHLIDLNTKEFTFSADFLPDLILGKGRDLNEKKNTYLNTRGYQLFGTIGSQFFFYTSGYENQARFTKYEMDYIDKVGMVPGQAYDRTTTSGSKDWAYVTALIGYKPNKNITIELGEDKTFIGDGYRSLLLSDYAAAYPLLRVTATLSKHIQYMAMWSYMEDQKAIPFNSFSNNRRKWGAFHYIDWNITNRASFGFFNALIAEEANDKGQGHGFDLNYSNPIFFSSGLRPSGTTPDHTLFGFNGKYKVLNKTTVYGQLLFDQSTSPNTNSNKSFQLGFRGFDFLKLKNLNYLFEYNSVGAYTYSNQNPIVSYNHFSEPLAHPYGANFKELLGIVNYSIGKFDLQGKVIYSKYGLNINNNNYGKDITLANNINLPSTAITNGQGMATTLKFAEGSIAYLINPKYNLRLEAGALLREEQNTLGDKKTAIISFGLRSSFRNLYHDF